MVIRSFQPDWLFIDVNFKVILTNLFKSVTMKSITKLLLPVLTAAFFMASCQKTIESSISGDQMDLKSTVSSQATTGQCVVQTSYPLSSIGRPLPEYFHRTDNGPDDITVRFKTFSSETFTMARGVVSPHWSAPLIGLTFMNANGDTILFALPNGSAWIFYSPMRMDDGTLSLHYIFNAGSVYKLQESMEFDGTIIPASSVMVNLENAGFLIFSHGLNGISKVTPWKKHDFLSPTYFYYKSSTLPFPAPTTGNTKTETKKPPVKTPGKLVKTTSFYPGTYIRDYFPNDADARMKLNCLAAMENLGMIDGFKIKSPLSSIRYPVGTISFTTDFLNEVYDASGRLVQYDKKSGRAPLQQTQTIKNVWYCP